MAGAMRAGSIALLSCTWRNIPLFSPSQCSRKLRVSIPSSSFPSFPRCKNLCCSASSPSLNAKDNITTSCKPSVTEEAPADALREAVEMLDIRVGRILKAWKHPEADSLYVEEVDVGDPEPRTICSGLVNYIAQDELQGRNVVVLANLKPRNMRGIKSNGMLLAASDASHENVELLSPPEGSCLGERVWFGSEEESNSQSDAASPSQVQKKKIWETVQPHLKTTNNCVAMFGERPMRTSSGLVSCGSLKNANIS